MVAESALAPITVTRLILARSSGRMPLFLSNTTDSCAATQGQRRMFRRVVFGPMVILREKAPVPARVEQAEPEPRAQGIEQRGPGRFRR